MSAPTRTRTASSVAAGLRVWAAQHRPHVGAAVELLVRHGVWLRRAEFLAAAVHRHTDGSYWIDWTAARTAFDAAQLGDASPSERAVLDLAIALGQDRYQLGSMSTGKARLVTTAVAAAGIPLPRRPDRNPLDDVPAAAGETEHSR